MGNGDEVMRPAVFLDRDGVISRPTIREGKPYPPHSLAELELLPGVQEALRALKAGRYCLSGGTNQPGPRRRPAPHQSFYTINPRPTDRLPCDAVRTICP